MIAQCMGSEYSETTWAAPNEGNEGPSTSAPAASGPSTSAAAAPQTPDQAQARQLLDQTTRMGKPPVLDAPLGDPTAHYFEQTAYIGDVACYATFC